MGNVWVFNVQSNMQRLGCLVIMQYVIHNLLSYLNRDNKARIYYNRATCIFFFNIILFYQPIFIIKIIYCSCSMYIIILTLIKLSYLVYIVTPPPPPTFMV